MQKDQGHRFPHLCLWQKCFQEAPSAPPIAEPLVLRAFQEGIQDSDQGLRNFNNAPAIRTSNLLLQVCSDLQSLNFSPLSTSFKISSGDFIQLIQCCANLTTLDLSNYHFEMDAILLEVCRLLAFEMFPFQLFV